MKKGTIAAIMAALLSVAGIARAVEVYSENFDGAVPAFTLTLTSDPLNNTEMLNGFATNRWMVAVTAVTNNGAGKMTLTSNKLAWRSAIYTITADQFPGPDTGATLTFDVTDIENLGSLEVRVFGIVNPGTAGDAVKYSVLSSTPLTADGASSVTQLGSLSIGGLADNDVPTVVTNHTVTFNYNGTDDIVLVFAPVGTSTANKKVTMDNVVVSASDTYSASLLTDPSDALSLTVTPETTSVTGTVSVSYIESSSPTNVTITSVSVVDQSHPGAFANATTLPLALNNPYPSNEVLAIAFDNSVAGIANGATSTGVVEIVWNEAGQSSVTSSLPVSAISLAVYDGNIIAIFDDTFNGADRALQGLVARISGGAGVDAAYGCNDTTYGTLPGLAPTEGGSLKILKTSPETLTPVVSITNNTGYDVVLDSLHFDILKRFNLTPGAVNVSISGDVSSALLLSSDTATNFTVSSATLADYDDFDITLTNLADRTLANGEGLTIEFAFIDDQGGGSPTTLDNIALLGSGSNGATLTKVPGGAVRFALTGLDTGASETIGAVYAEGDAATNVVVTGVAISGQTHPGAFGYSGAFPVQLSTPGATNEIFALLFDNTVANLAAGETASALVEIAWNEAGLGGRTLSFNTYATRPATTPTNAAIAMFDTIFLSPDAAANGVLGTVSGGAGIDTAVGSNDGTYGSLSELAAPVEKSAYKVQSQADIPITLSVTNQTVANIVLSSINFDVGRIWLNSSEAFTLSVSGDLSNDPTLLVASNLTAILANLGDADDFDVDLTGLADHTLAAGESAVFTFSFVPKPETPWYGTYIDNVALMGTFDTFGGWAADIGLTLGVNDDPNDNPDNDGMDNLMEFATGNDPLVADGPAADNWQSAEGGTNWFYHVHTERTDDPGLGYSVGAKDNLLYSPEWIGTNVEFVGESSGPGLFKSVTNRTDMGSTAEFIRLKVDKD